MSPRTVFLEMQSAESAAVAHAVAWIVKLAEREDYVRAIAKTEGVGIAALADALRRVSPGSVSIQVAQEKVNFNVTVRAERCRPYRVYFYVPWSAFSGGAALEQWLRWEIARANASAFEAIVSAEVAARRHARAMARLGEKDRTLIVRKANALEKRAAKRGAS